MIMPEFWRLESGERGVVAPGSWFRARTTLWMILLFSGAALLMLSSYELGDWLHLPEASGVYIGIFVPPAGFALYSLAVRFGERRGARELGLFGFVPSLAIGTLTGFSFMASIVALEWGLGLLSVSRGHWQHWFQYLVFNAYISAMVEELGFRAILLRLCARMFGPVPGLVISAALFALAHAGHASATDVALLMINGGLLLGVLYMVSGSLWVAIGAHIAYDFTEWSIFGVGDHDGYWVVAPSPGHAAWLTGGTFGPDGSVISAFVALALVCATLAIGRHRSGGAVMVVHAAPVAGRA